MNTVQKNIPSIPLWIPVVIGNLIPLYGVLFLEWNIFSVFFLYWIENVIIGIYTVLKMIGVGVSLFSIKHQLAKIGTIIGTTFFIGFFTLHYGMFTMGHLTFLSSFFYEGSADFDLFNTKETFLFVQHVLFEGLFWGAFAIFIAEGIKAVIDLQKPPLIQTHLSSGKIPQETLDFLRAKNPEFNPEDIGKISRMPQLMMEPYGRIFVLHLTLVFGGFLVEVLDRPVWALGLLIILKIGYDLEAIDPMKKLKQKNKNRSS